MNERPGFVPAATDTLAPTGTVRDWLERRARESPDAVSHRYCDSTLHETWNTLLQSARDFAARIAGLGIEPGESVAYLAPNGPGAVACLFGSLYGGYRATPLNLVAGPDALGHAIGHCGARVLLAETGTLEILEPALRSTEVRPRIISFDERGAFDWPADSREAEPGTVTAGDDALLMYTSGTTGRPKGVLHSHASLLAGGWTPTLAHRLTPADTALCVLPHYHINGLCVTLMGPLVSGGSVALAPRFSAGRFWTWAEDQQATWFSAVPTILSHLLHGEAEPNAATRERIRFARSASAPLSPDVQQAFEARFGIPIVETMGLTETAAQILSNPLPPGLRKIGSPGVAVGNRAMIGDEHQREVPRGETGEVLIAGPNVMRGYLNDAEATAAALTPDGWLHTGDLGRMDADGYVFITGRLKELIIKGGENIAPREIDEALLSHPDVVEAAAYPVPCPTYGQWVEAAVVLRPGAAADAAELKAHCVARLGAFKAPDVVHLMSDLPKGPSGKVQRLKLAEAAGAA